MQEADFYEKTEEDIICILCPHRCHIPEGNTGRCKARKNIDGKLYSLFYGKPITICIDPIEKKPLYHFLPGSKTLSLCTVGCNFSCRFCQNSEISQITEKTGNFSRLPYIEPSIIADMAKENSCKSISYTYTEPTIFYEYVYDISKIAKEKGIKNILVTNGFINPKPLKKIAPYIDAANIDLKSFKERFYNEQCNGRLAPVKKTIKLMHELKIKIEITTLIIEKKNDSDEELTKIATFIKNIDPKIPWHISAAHPSYLAKEISQTSIHTLKKAYEIGKKIGLHYIYIGNVKTDIGKDTFCPICNSTLITRDGYQIKKIHIKNNRCESCNNKIDIIL